MSYFFFPIGTIWKHWIQITRSADFYRKLEESDKNFRWKKFGGFTQIKDVELGIPEKSFVGSWEGIDHVLEI